MDLSKNAWLWNICLVHGAAGLLDSIGAGNVGLGTDVIHAVLGSTICGTSDLM